MIPLEDNFTDIVGKAQRGLNLAGSALAGRAGVTLAEVNALRGGAVDEAVVRKVAGALGLGAEALVASARGAWRPREAGAVAGLGCFTTPFGDMTVNAYVVYDAGTGEAAAFDTGADCGGMVEFLREKELAVKVILLTHVHTDHVADLERLKAATGAKVWVSGREPLAGAETFGDGKIFEVGKLKIETRRTSGHARGGTTFVVTGLKGNADSQSGPQRWRWWGMRCSRGRWGAGWWIMRRHCGRIGRGFLRWRMRRSFVRGTGR